MKRMAAPCKVYNAHQINPAKRSIIRGLRSIIDFNLNEY